MRHQGGRGDCAVHSTMWLAGTAWANAHPLLASSLDHDLKDFNRCRFCHAGLLKRLTSRPRYGGGARLFVPRRVPQRNGHGRAVRSVDHAKCSVESLLFLERGDRLLPKAATEHFYTTSRT